MEGLRTENKENADRMIAAFKRFATTVVNLNLLHLSGQRVKLKINNLTLCHNKEGSSIRNLN
jgi:hypothetical protein